MPGPLIKFNPLDVPNIASKLPEPLQKPGGMALQTIFDMMGAGDPDSAIPTPAPAAPLITRFLTGGVPNKSLREKFSKTFIDSARQMFTGRDLDEVEKLANKYPRVAAHARLGKLTQPVDPRELGRVDVGESLPIPGADVGQGRRPLSLRTDLVDPRLNYIPAASAAHEMTHIAQLLGNKQSPKLYDLAADLVGYNANPFEVSARQTAARKLDQLAGVPAKNTLKPAPVMKQFQSIAGAGTSPELRKILMERSHPTQTMRSQLDYKRTSPKVFGHPVNTATLPSIINALMIKGAKKAPFADEDRIQGGLDFAGRMMEDSSDPNMWGKTVRMLAGHSVD